MNTASENGVFKRRIHMEYDEKAYEKGGWKRRMTKAHEICIMRIYSKIHVFTCFYEKKLGCLS